MARETESLIRPWYNVHINTIKLVNIMAIHYRHDVRSKKEADGVRTWGQRLRQNIARMSSENYGSDMREEEAEITADDPPGELQTTEEPHIAARPDWLPLSESEYDLMRRALIRQTSAARVEQGYAHALDVAGWCVRVARKRSLDEHIACLTGFFHDVYYYATGLRPLHALNSAEQVEKLLARFSELSEEAQRQICHVILCHHDEDKVCDPMSELLRDAHILSEYTGPRHAVRKCELKRLTQLVPEWKLLDPQRSQVIEPSEPVYQGDRYALAEVAQTLAAQRISWYAGEPDALNISRYWPEEDAFERLTGDWSAAFVYHCCYESGFILPLRAPDVEQRFDRIKGWLDFASRLNNGFYHPKGESGFLPERGDIVIFDRILEDKLPADHMGVVVMTSPERITVAEGNARGSNVSDVIEHSATHHVRGYIRLPNDYRVGRSFN